jgi:hypothetical protein
VVPETQCRATQASLEVSPLGTKIGIIFVTSRRCVSEIKLKRTDTFDKLAMNL